MGRPILLRKIWKIIALILGSAKILSFFFEFPCKIGEKKSIRPFRKDRFYIAQAYLELLAGAAVLKVNYVHQELTPSIMNFKES